MNTVENRLSDREKISFIQNYPKLKKKWNSLTCREEKEEILKGMDIALDVRWVLGLFEDFE